MIIGLYLINTNNIISTSKLHEYIYKRRELSAMDGNSRLRLVGTMIMFFIIISVAMEGDIDVRHKHRHRPPLKDPHHCPPKHRPPPPKDNPSLQVLATHFPLIYDYKCYKACVKAECKYIAIKKLEDVGHYVW